jgi:hypothetical protein
MYEQCSVGNSEMQKHVAPKHMKKKTLPHIVNIFSKKTFKVYKSPRKDIVITNRRNSRNRPHQIQSNFLPFLPIYKLV